MFEKPTYASFIALLDNYIAKSGNAEEVTQTELNEQELFLDNFCNTRIGEYLFQLFVEKSTYRFLLNNQVVTLFLKRVLTFINLCKYKSLIFNVKQKNSRL